MKRISLFSCMSVAYALTLGKVDTNRNPSQGDLAVDKIRVEAISKGFLTIELKDDAQAVPWKAAPEQAGLTSDSRRVSDGSALGHDSRRVSDGRVRKHVFKKSRRVSENDVIEKVPMEDDTVQKRPEKVPRKHYKLTNKRPIGRSASVASTPKPFATIRSFPIMPRWARGHPTSYSHPVRMPTSDRRAESATGFLPIKPMVIEKKPMSMNKKPMSMDKTPMSINRKPMSMDKEPMFNDKVPMIVNKKRLSIDKTSMSIDRKPMSIDRKPMSIDRKPKSIDRKPMIMNKKPMSMNKKPMSNDKEPMFIDKVRMSDDKEPKFIEKVPMSVDKESKFINKVPMSIDKEPMDL